MKHRTALSLITAFLVISVLAVFGQVMYADFLNLDDNILISENPNVQEGLTFSSLTWAFTTTEYTIWHPLTLVSFIIDYELFGLNPGGFHLINLLLHVVNTLLLFYVFQKMTGELWKSAFVSALFSLHPLHVESVAWITERKDVLSTLFWLLTTTAYFHYTKAPGFRRYLFILIPFILGLLTKAMLITLPFVLLLLDFWPLKRLCHSVDNSGAGSCKKRISSFLKDLLPLIKEKAVLFIVVAVFTFVNINMAQKTGNLYDSETIPPELRIGYALVSYINYIYKTLWPTKLAIHYPLPEAVPLWHSVGAGLILLLLTLLIVRISWKYRFLLTGFLWYIGTLVPVIGFLKIGTQSANDRFTYIPLTGLFIIVAWGVPELVKNRPKWKGLLPYTAGAVIVCFMTLTWLQVKQWKNSRTIFSHALRVTDNNALAHFCLAKALADEGDIGGAIDHYKRALHIKPGYKTAYYNLANILVQRGLYDEAEANYMAALKRDSQYIEAYNNLGLLYRKKGETDKAVEVYSKALSINPDYTSILNNMGVIWIDRGEFRKAGGFFLKVLEAEPRNLEAHLHMGVLLSGLAIYEKAIFHYKEALKIDPDYAEAHINLGSAFKATGKTTEALRHFYRAMELNPEIPEIHFNIGNLLNTQGDRAGAVKSFNRAIELRQDYTRAHTALAITLANGGEMTRAVEHFGYAAKAQPFNAEAALNLGVALEFVGRKEEAIVEYCKAFRLQPDLRSVIVKMEEVMLESGVPRSGNDNEISKSGAAFCSRLNN